MKYCRPFIYTSNVFKRHIVLQKRREPKSDKFYIDNILEVICVYFSITEYRLKSQSRKRVYTDSRSIAMYLIRRYVPNMTLKKMGEMFGGRDHSTVIYSITKFNELHETDNIFRLDYEKIQALLNLKFEYEEAA